MKRKIDKIKGKRLVMGGGTNLLTKDEILVTETPNGVELKERSSDGSIKEIASGSGGEDTNKNIKYYKFIGDLDKNIISVLLMPITEIIYEYYHREEGRLINKCSSGRLVADSYGPGSIITVFAFIDNIENFYIFGTEVKNYKEYVDAIKDMVGVEFEDLFEEIDKATYDEIFNTLISNINS